MRREIRRCEGLAQPAGEPLHEMRLLVGRHLHRMKPLAHIDPVRRNGVPGKAHLLGGAGSLAHRPPGPAHAPDPQADHERRRRCRKGARADNRRGPPAGEVGHPQAGGNRLANLEGQPRAQGLALLDLLRSLRRNRRIGLQVSLDDVETPGREPAVDEGLQIVFPDRSLVRHFTLLRTALRPASMNCLNRPRPRLSRDMTVPTGRPRASAACS